MLILIMEARIKFLLKIPTKGTLALTYKDFRQSIETK